MLTGTETTLTVPEECTLWEILQLHLPHNAHAASYVWKFGDRPLDMHKTLDQNGVRSGEERMEGDVCYGALVVK